VQHELDIVPVDVVYSPVFLSENSIIYEVYGVSRKEQTSEWMYEIASHSKVGSLKTEFCNAFALYSLGRFDAAGLAFNTLSKAALIIADSESSKETRVIQRHVQRLALSCAQMCLKTYPPGTKPLRMASPLWTGTLLPDDGTNTTKSIKGLWTDDNCLSIDSFIS
jgi:hypothetical protein